MLYSILQVSKVLYCTSYRGGVYRRILGGHRAGARGPLMMPTAREGNYAEFAATVDLVPALWSVRASF